MRMLGVALVSSLILASPLLAQDSPFALSLEGHIGWLEPTTTLASPNPEFAFSARHGAVESGPTIGVGLQARLPAPFPKLRLSSSYLIGSDLVLEDQTESRSLGSVSLMTGLLEAVFEPLRIGSFGAHGALGVGFVRYGFPEIDDEELAPLFEDNISPAVSLGVGGSWRAGPGTILLEVSDMISTFDSPPVESQNAPEETVDIDEIQHDVRLSIGFSYPFWSR